MPVLAAGAGTASAVTGHAAAEQAIAASGATTLSGVASDSEQLNDYLAQIQEAILKQIEAANAAGQTGTTAAAGTGTISADGTAVTDSTADAAAAADASQDTTVSGSDDTAAEDTTEKAAASSTWTGPKLTAKKGANYGPSGKETFYNLDMSWVVWYMHYLGYTGEYHVREDGVKMLGDYILCGADFSKHPRGSLIETSLGTAIVADTGDFSISDIEVDIATTW